MQKKYQSYTLLASQENVEGGLQTPTQKLRSDVLFSSLVIPQDSCIWMNVALSERIFSIRGQIGGGQIFSLKPALNIFVQSKRIFENDCAISFVHLFKLADKQNAQK